jgi:hypothetical protein
MAELAAVCGLQQEGRLGRATVEKMNPLFPLAVVRLCRLRSGTCGAPAEFVCPARVIDGGTIVVTTP